MPGYYDWKVRNCTEGAMAKASSLLQTMDAADVELHRIWKEGGGSFPPDVNDKLAGVVELIDQAEDCLEKAKLKLADHFLPGGPNEAAARKALDRVAPPGGEKP